ncbi:MAG: glycosyltransferase family 4 protein [Bryobacter sp.]|nr:glycosyltransferase family 4 protein [Bryobacter sp.]
MKILLADAGYQMRGGQWQTLYLAEGLRERGHQVRLLASYGSKLWDLAHQAGLDTRQTGFTTVFGLTRWADVLHVQDASSHTLAALASRIPFLVSRRVAFPVKDNWLSRRKYARAAGYLAVSHYVAKELKRTGIPAEKIRVVHDGVPDVTPAAYAHHLCGLASEDPGKLNPLMQESARLAGLSLRMPAALLESISSGLLFLYLSKMEGLGSAALYAMAAGLPVIASRVGGLPETIDEGFSGILVPNDAPTIAQAILTLAHDRNLQLHFSENARRRYLAHFTDAHMVDNTLAAYRALLPHA